MSYIKLKQVTEISISITRPSRILVLTLDFVPTQEEFVLCVQNIVTEKNYEDIIRWMFVEAARKAKIPRKGGISKVMIENPNKQHMTEVVIRHDTGLMFQKARAISSMVEQVAVNHPVPGSNPG